MCVCLVEAGRVVSRPRSAPTADRLFVRHRFFACFGRIFTPSAATAVAYAHYALALMSLLAGMVFSYFLTQILWMLILGPVSLLTAISTTLLAIGISYKMRPLVVVFLVYQVTFTLAASIVAIYSGIVAVSQPQQTNALSLNWPGTSAVCTTTAIFELLCCYFIICYLTTFKTRHQRSRDPLRMSSDDGLSPPLSILENMTVPVEVQLAELRSQHNMPLPPPSYLEARRQRRQQQQQQLRRVQTAPSPVVTVVTEQPTAVVRGSASFDDTVEIIDLNRWIAQHMTPDIETDSVHSADLD